MNANLINLTTKQSIWRNQWRHEKRYPMFSTFYLWRYRNWTKFYNNHCFHQNNFFFKFFYPKKLILFVYGKERSYFSCEITVVKITFYFTHENSILWISDYLPCLKWITLFLFLDISDLITSLLDKSWWKRKNIQ